MQDLTLEQIENDYWGPPEFSSHLVTTCHQLRQKPLCEFTAEDLRLMIGQSLSLPILVPLALDHLNGQPMAEGDFFPGDLLKNMLQLDGDLYKTNPQHTKRLIAITKRALIIIQNDPEELFYSDDPFTHDMVDLFSSFIQKFEPEI